MAAHCPDPGLCGLLFLAESLGLRALLLFSSTCHLSKVWGQLCPLEAGTASQGGRWSWSKGEVTGLRPRHASSTGCCQCLLICSQNELQLTPASLGCSLRSANGFDPGFFQITASSLDSLEGNIYSLDIRSLECVKFCAHPIRVET